MIVFLQKVNSGLEQFPMPAIKKQSPLLLLFCSLDGIIMKYSQMETGRDRHREIIA
jgi:hypothetical protein